MKIEDLQDIFCDACLLDDGRVEISDYTDKGYNIVITAESCNRDDVIERIKDLDSGEEVTLWWSNDSYRANYNHSIIKAAQDIENWKEEYINKVANY